MRYMIETERSDLFDVSIVIAMKVSIKGNVTEASLRSAFEEAAQSHEILGSRVVIEEDGTAYYESAVQEGQQETQAGMPGIQGAHDTDQAIVLSKNRSYHQNNKIYFEDSSWLHILKREEKIRFKIEEGEFMKAFCYEMNDEGCSILFLMHHLGGDGKSFVYFIESFMRALSGEKLEFSNMRLIPAGPLDDKSKRDRLGPLAFVPKSYNNKWNKDTKKQVFSYADMDQGYDTYWRDHESVVDEYIIRPETVKNMLEKCRAWNIGFTAYITASFLRWLGRKADVGYAVDARTDGNRCMGNQATGISIKYAYKYNKSFKENAIKVQELMTKKLEDDQSKEFILPFMASFEPTLVDAINLEHAGSFRSKTSKSLATILGYRKKTKDLSFTNLTKLDIPEVYGEYKLDFFSFIPPVISYGKNIVGMSTLGDCTVLTLHRIKKI